MTLQLVTADDCRFGVRACEVLDRLGVRAQVAIDSPEADGLPAKGIRSRSCQC